ncbi:hypothetical protein Trydic_g14999 [Trypoxylus dichotomus]
MKKFLASVAMMVATFSFARCDTPVSACDNGISLPSLIQVNNCESSPCELVQGTTTSLNVTFIAQDYIEGLKPEVIAYALGAEVNYPLSETDGCNSLINIRCPIDAGELVRYNLQMPILSIYPTISLRMKFTIYNENENGLTCFVIDARVVSPSN